MEAFQKLVKETIHQQLSDPETHELLVDEYVANYLNKVFLAADYGNKDILSIVIRVLAPILFNLRLTASKDDAAEIVSGIFTAVAEAHPQ
jgi:hypothetical protein